MKRIILYTLAIFAFVGCNLDGMQTMKGKYYDDIPLHVQEAEIGIEKEPGCIRIVQYNVGAFHKSGSSSIGMISDMMKEIETDIMSLNEVDKNTKRTGYVDQLNVLAANMDWNYKFGKAIEVQGGDYGNGLGYDKEFSVKASYAPLLPHTSIGEQRMLLVVEFADFVIASTHLDLQEIRNQQAAFINQFIQEKYANSNKPVFICGDFNEGPSGKAIQTIQEKWTMVSENANTTVSGNNCIDYVFLFNNPGASKVEIVKTKVMTNFASGSVSTASDHLPVFVDFKLL